MVDIDWDAAPRSPEERLHTINERKARRHGIDFSRGDYDDLGYGSGADHRGRGPHGYTRSDASIADDLYDALTRHAGIDATDVEMHVERGEVTLSGTVGTRVEKYLAEDLAWEIGGVRHVANRLHLRGHKVARPR